MTKPVVMKKLLLLYAFLSSFQICTFSQSCLPEGITFSTQEQIDSFQANYPGCTIIEGSVQVQEESDGNITSLIGLNVLTELGGDLLISYNDSLTSLTGLENLISIEGSCLIKNNIVLPDLNGLNYLNSIGGSLFISDNDTLTSLAGLEALVYIGDDLTIGSTIPSGNPSNIENLSGLVNLSVLEDDLNIFLNGVLTNLTGLNNLDFLRGDLKVYQNNSLINLTGLENLSALGYGRIDIRANPALINLEGLNNIDFIDGPFYCRDNSSLTSLSGIESMYSTWGDLWLYNNPNLSDISALSTLYTVGGDIRIQFNDALESLTGLDYITENSIGSLEINNNLNLSTCEVECICDYLADPSGSIEIHDNAPGCNSPEEVELACTVDVGESSISSRRSAVVCYPNPASNLLTFDIHLQSSGEVQLMVFNSLGQPVATIIDELFEKGDHKFRWNAGEFPQGIYFYRIIESNRPITGKLLLK
jgi:hypothetical protein